MLPSMSWLEDRASEGADNGETHSLSSFKSILGGVEEEDDWFLNSNNQIQTHPELNFATNLIDSSSCSPSSASVFSHLDPTQVQFFLPQNLQRNPFETSFDSGFENPFMDNNNDSLNRGNGGFTGFTDLAPNSQIGSSVSNPNPQFQLTQMLNLPENNPQMDFGSTQFTGLGENLLFNRPKTLKPLDNFASTGSQPTLFQKRAALRKNLGANNKGDNLVINSSEGQNGKRKMNGGDDEEEGEDLSFNGYDSEDFIGNGGNSSSTVTNGGGDGKGKKNKKGLPAKNLMAERRRRKKLNDRLYMLRSVVPKISKMDRASILGDAIEYLKELLQKINDLHNELEMNPHPTTISSSSAVAALTPPPAATTTTSFYPLTPTPLPLPLPSPIKQEQLYPPTSNGHHPSRVEVRLREGRAVNIHMFCGRKPGLLLSTMRALDNLGLDIQQAVISCFNAFALDIFRAEQCTQGQELHPDQIKAVLLDSAGLL